MTGPKGLGLLPAPRSSPRVTPSILLRPSGATPAMPLQTHRTSEAPDPTAQVQGLTHDSERIAPFRYGCCSEG